MAIGIITIILGILIPTIMIAVPEKIWLAGLLTVVFVFFLMFYVMLLIESDTGLKLKQWPIYLTILCVLGPLLVGVFIFGITYYLKPVIVKRVGTLHSKSTTILSKHHIEFASIEIGDSEIVLPKEQIDYLNSMFGDVNLRVYKDNKSGNINYGPLKLSLSIYNESGIQIAEIDGNEWKVNKNEMIAYDLNYSNIALEVINGKGEVVLQVKLLQDRIQLSFVLYNKFGIPFSMGCGPSNVFYITNIPKSPATFDLGKYKSDKIHLKILPMFNYPSQYHLGELLTKDDCRKKIETISWKGKEMELCFWIRKAAILGDPEYQVQMATMRKLGGFFKQDTTQAISWYKKAIDQNHIPAYNGLAWLYATSSDPNHQNGKMAISYAQKCLKYNRNYWQYHDTLAAAFARDNQFAKAIQSQKEAIELLENDKKLNKEKFEMHLKETKDRLALYKSNKCYTEQ